MNANGCVICGGQFIWGRWGDPPQVGYRCPKCGSIRNDKEQYAAWKVKTKAHPET